MPNTRKETSQGLHRQPHVAQCLLHSGTGHVHHATIEEIGESCLRISFAAPVTLPQHVEISCQALGLRRRARVVWQRQGLAGLSLVPGDAGGLSRGATA
jgi:hypothetical protein